MSDSSTCPFNVGDLVRFTPSPRTRGLYQNIERFGLRVDQEAVVKEIKEGMYLYFEGGAGGWPWNEFVLVREAEKDQADLK